MGHLRRLAEAKDRWLLGVLGHTVSPQTHVRAEPKTMTLSGKGGPFRCDEVLPDYGGSESNDCVLRGKGNSGTQTHTGKPCVEEAEVGTMQLQIQDLGNHQEPGEAGKIFP